VAAGVPRVIMVSDDAACAAAAKAAGIKVLQHTFQVGATLCFAHFLFRLLPVTGHLAHRSRQDKGKQARSDPTHIPFLESSHTEPSAAPPCACVNRYRPSQDTWQQTTLGPIGAMLPWPKYCPWAILQCPCHQRCCC
jgi:hypothetical protein